MFAEHVLSRRAHFSQLGNLLERIEAVYRPVGLSQASAPNIK